MGKGKIMRRTHSVIFPTPAMGHLIPLTEFATRLVLTHNFSVTFIIPNFRFPIKSQESFLDSSMPKTIQLLTESTRLVALVVDVAGTDAFEVAREFNLLRYISVPLCAMSLSLLLHLPKLNEEAQGYSDYKDIPDPIKIPGCLPIRGTQLVDVMQNRNTHTYKLFIYHTKRFNLADGIIVNSFLDLEPGAFNAFVDEEDDGSGKKPPVYPIGPVLQTRPTSGNDDDVECLRWLDEQPRGSVLFASFGSSGTLSQEQLTELALGLETSEQRFIWDSASGVHYNAQSINKDDDPFDFLPKGFVERTTSGGLGLLVRSWALQIQILSHGSTGGFLSHCGWNSILESLVNGVPLIAWPLFGEQEMHTEVLTKQFKIAFRPKKNENDDLVGREIAKLVRDLIIGE
ncbi:hydroquinone glucosyltransferase-like [Camellia sinensis]|uniref:hydroquinone glucosyltransferase-like n=1 Tax=Camellia sinensis TaxID=4442 RepID=UPI001035D15B|nr:hydroquinone glucosyltransferase-like [Camellia sinensis]